MPKSKHRKKHSQKVAAARNRLNETRRHIENVEMKKVKELMDKFEANLRAQKEGKNEVVA